MSTSSGPVGKEEVARIAGFVWEAEGRPVGRDHEHWMRAKELIAEGRAHIEFPAAADPEAAIDPHDAPEDAAARKPGQRRPLRPAPHRPGAKVTIAQVTPGDGRRSDGRRSLVPDDAKPAMIASGAHRAGRAG